MKKFVFLIFVLSILLITQSLFAQRTEPEKTEVRGHTMFTVLQPGEIPAIFEPEFLTIAEAEQMFYPDENLLVVRDGDVVKGYSTWHLDNHEIVNDYINGKAITVTW